MRLSRRRRVRGPALRGGLFPYPYFVRTARNLCLHYVARPGEARRGAISPCDLAALLGREQQDRAPGSVEAYLDEPPGPERFTVSFDDAHTSVSLAVPVLSAAGIRPTLFVPTDFVGTSAEFLSWAELAALRDAGWILGSHLATHPRGRHRLYDEDDVRHAARLHDECARSREALERRLGVCCELLAYPFGEHTPALADAARAAGYRAAFTVTDAAWQGDLLAIPRIDPLVPRPLIEDAGPPGISVVLPARDRLPVLSEVVRRLCLSSYPADRHEIIVVDDGSADGGRRLAETCAQANASAEGPGVKVLRLPEGASFRAGQARQLGADHARFPIVQFLDADVAVDRDFLWHAAWPHERTARAVVLGYLSGYNLHDHGFAHRVGDLAPLLPGTLEDALPVYPDRSREPTLRACLDNLDWLAEPWRLSYTGNLSLSRALLDEVGGFSRDFVGWGLEDVDLGLRLFRAGAELLFSRFALGFHLQDPDEARPRNPFRDPRPERPAFSGYLRNLEVLRQHHVGDAALAAFCDRALADIDELVGRPDTVGVEMGGRCRNHCAFHRELNRCQAGGTPRHELYDRVAHAARVGARSLHLLGGEPLEHPDLEPLLDHARGLGVRHVTCHSNGVPLGEPARQAALRGRLTHVVLKRFGTERASYDAMTGGAGTFALAQAGRRWLLEEHAAGRTGVSCVIVIGPANLGALEPLLDEAVADGLRVEDVLAVGGASVSAIAARVRRWAGLGRPAPTVRVGEP